MQKYNIDINYLQLLIRFYMDSEDQGIASLLMRINQSLERMKACA
jgi:hypothetical protein